MPAKWQLRGAWYVLSAMILWASCLPFSSWTRQVLATSVSSIWIHFIVYAIVAMIPVWACTRKSAALLCLSLTGATIVIELVRFLLADQVGDVQLVAAHMFGIAAGILLGLNLRMMYASVRKQRTPKRPVCSEHPVVIGMSQVSKKASWEITGTESLAGMNRE